MPRAKIIRCEMVSDGRGVFVACDGLKIAKRGRPGTPQARTWVSLEPGWRVLDSFEGDQYVITVEYKPPGRSS
jgi:hypothetical protein